MNYNLVFLFLGVLIVIMYISNIYNINIVSDFQTKNELTLFQKSDSFINFIYQFNKHLKKSDIVAISSNIYIKNSLPQELKAELETTINNILNISNQINNWDNHLVSIERVKEEKNCRNVKKIYVTFFIYFMPTHSTRKLFLVYIKQNKNIIFNHLQLL